MNETKTEIRFVGFGGQGIILAAHITGRAITIYEKSNATLTQNYGPESRGGSCAAGLIISDQPINYPHLTKPDVLVVLSPEGYNKYKDDIKNNGLIIVEENILPVVSIPEPCSAPRAVEPGRTVAECPPERLINRAGTDIDKKPKARTLAVPAARLAREIGKKVVTNMIVLGFMVRVFECNELHPTIPGSNSLRSNCQSMTAATKFVSKEAMRQSIATSVPPGTEELNLKAFEMGYSNYKP
ncbi:MAG: 2-oxoacid:acceptor oxidoreductase family protein [Planctomycetota bacterium]